MNEIAIKVQNIGKWYPIAQSARSRNPSHDDFIWALKEVSFEVGKGEVVGLIGPNGAGKSTLLKILSRITPPTTGSIDIYGRVASMLEVGTGFHKELSGRDNIYLNGSILGMKKSEIARKFDEIVAFAEVENYVDTTVKFYSSGMTVRLAFAVAAHLNPEILLVDEILAVGDAAFQKKSLLKMESVGQAGRTVIFVSHQLTSITRLCKRVMLLNHGQLIEDGPAEEVVASYLTTGLGMGACQEWTVPHARPGDDRVRLQRVRVIDEERRTNYSFDIRRPVGIEMTYDVLQPGLKLYPHFSLLNDRDMCLFISQDTDQMWHDRVRPVGRYTSIAWIPGNLLAEGSQKVCVSMQSENPHCIHFREIESVAFQMIESPDGDTARVDNTGRIRGVLRPYLPWKTRYEPIREKNEI